MDTYTTETQRIEEIKKWWQENGLSVVLALALGFSGIFGWRYWQGQQVEDAEAASALYSNMMTALQDKSPTEVRAAADEILADFENTTYGVFALMTLAALAVEEEDLKAAETLLRQALEQSGNEPLAHVIRIRLIRVLISLDDLEQARALAQRQGDGAFAADYDELQGDISITQGDGEAARAAYQRALDRLRADGRDVSTLELKLNNIGQT